MRRSALLLATLLASVVAPTVAHAQSAGDPGKARELATRGRAAFDAGDLAAGCPLLDQAVQLDPELLGAGFALAECREKEGKLATAHRQFLAIATRAEARGEDRAAEARARAAALAPRLPRLRVDVTEAARALPGLAITVDGTPWTASAWGAAEPLDPGPHAIAATADGRAPWSTRVEATEGATAEVAVPFGRDAAAPVDASPVAPASEAPGDERGGAFPWRTAGLVTAGVGVGTLGLGVVLGLVAKGSYDDAAGCDASNVCTPAGAAERNDARDLAGVGTVAFIAGGVLAAAGVTVFLVAPDDDAADAAALRVAPGAITLDGRF